MVIAHSGTIVMKTSSWKNITAKMPVSAMKG
jgi:hypothetical protein